MVLTAVFVKLWGENGIAIAYSVAGLSSAFLQTFFLKKRVGSIRKEEIRESVSKCAICCGVMFVVITAGIIIFEKYVSVDSKMAQLTEVGVLLGVGVFTYVIMAFALKMQELRSIIDVFKRRFSRR